MSTQLTNDIANILGLPKFTTKAVITLEADKLPTIEITAFVMDKDGRPVIEETSGEYGNGIAKRLAEVQFMVRLEPFSN